MQDSKYKPSMLWWLALKCFPIIFSPGNALVAMLLESGFTEGVVCRIYKFGLVVALEDTFFELGHLMIFFQNLFYDIIPLEQPLIQGSYSACCEGFAVKYWNIGKGVLQRNGRYKIFWILDVIFSNERNDVRFVRDSVIIWAYPIAVVWLGYLHILQQVF